MNDKDSTPSPASDIGDWPAAQARFHRFSVGDIEFVSLSDGGLQAQRAPVPGAPPVAPGSPPEIVLVPLSILLARLPTNGKLVLIDTGFGTWPIMHGRQMKTVAKLDESLGLAGFKPDDIDAVLISHMHPDHIGGMYTPDGEKRFPNADYYIGAEELAFWSEDPLDLTGTDSPPPIKIQMAEYAARMLSHAQGELKTFRAGETILSEIETVLLEGHSPGQIGFIFESKRQKLIYSADALANATISVQAPDARNPMDMYSNTGIKTRHRLLKLLSAPEWKNFATHFPWPSVGSVQEVDGAHRWEAIV